MRFQFLLLFMGLSLFGSCTETTTTSSGLFGEDTQVARHSFLTSKSHVMGALPVGASGGALARGTDQFLNPSFAAGGGQAIVVPRDGETVEFSLVDASIAKAAEAVLREALGKAYTISPQVSGKITIQSTGPIQKDALLDLFAAALAANNARMETEKGVIMIVPGSSGNRSFRLASQGVGGGASILVAPLQFVSASQMVQLLEPLVAEGLKVTADRNRNLLMMSGPRNLMEAGLDSLNLFDVDVLQGKSVALVRITSGDPEAMVSELKSIFETEEGGNLNGVIEFVPNNRLGSILVITSRSTYLSRAQQWIRQLDSAARGADRFIVAYEMENRSAEEIAPILNQLLSEIASDGEGSNQVVRAAADEARNALIVRANQTEHAEIQNLLKQLDSSPQQVMLEATIAEVTINDNMGLGLRWFLSSGNFGVTFSDASSGSVGSTFPGFSAIFNGPSVDVAINALADVTDVRIISSPTLMVLDNQKAVLQIGDQVPIATRAATDVTDPSAPIVTQVEYRDTGVILSVLPSINRNGRVVLEVSQEVSDVAATVTSGIDSPTIRQRKIATNVLLDDGATLALGGLVQEGDTETVTKVPVLGDAPVVGALFRDKNVRSRRSELLILIRPRVVSTPADAVVATEYWRTKLSAANSNLVRGLGAPQHTLIDVLR